MTDYKRLMDYDRSLNVIVRVIENNDSVPLAWVVKWSEGNRDPLVSAWGHSVERKEEWLSRAKILDYLEYELPKGIRKWSASWTSAYLGTVWGKPQTHKQAILRVNQFNNAMRRINRNPPAIQALLAKMQTRR